jgi:diacylglycerol kinase (ATP)
VNEPPRYCLVVNLAAGAGRARARWRVLEAALRARGVRFDVAFTERPGDAVQLAASAARQASTTVVAVGGDGTINEVLNGLLQARPPETAGSEPPILGVLPSGTAQDFARSAGIPLTVQAAVDRLVYPRPQPCDVGRIRYPAGGVRYFANYAGVGFDAMVAAQAQRNRVGLRGALPYVLGFFTVLHGYENPQIEIALDGGPPLVAARPTNMVIVANGANYAGMLRMAPYASLTDGLLEVVIVGDVGRLELVASLPLALFGRHLGHPKVTAHRARTVTIEARPPVPIQSDGEPAGELPAAFDVLPGALRLLGA